MITSKGRQRNPALVPKNHLSGPVPLMCNKQNNTARWPTILYSLDIGFHSQRGPRRSHSRDVYGV